MPMTIEYTFLPLYTRFSSILLSFNESITNVYKLLLDFRHAYIYFEYLKVISFQSFVFIHLESTALMNDCITPIINPYD